MLEHIVKINEDVPIFCQLTQNSIVLCDSEGFEKVKNILCYFEKDQNGNPEYDYLWHKGDDFEKDIFVVEHISEKEILIKIGSEQTIRIFHFSERSDLTRLREMNYEPRDRWFSNWKEIYAFTEFKNYETWSSWESFLKGTYSGRFGIGVNWEE